MADNKAEKKAEKKLKREAKLEARGNEGLHRRVLAIETEHADILRGIVAVQQRLNAVWNTMNVVIRMQQELSGLSEQDFQKKFQEIGAKLFEEARAAQKNNIEKLRTGQSPVLKPDEMTKASVLLDAAGNEIKRN